MYISLNKIVSLSTLYKETSLIELEGANGVAVKVKMLAEELVRKINGEDKITIGFRAWK